MDVRDKVVVVTGSAQGIGRALSERFAREGAGGLVMADRDASVERAAHAAGGVPVVANVAHEPEVVRIVNTALDRFGRVDLFCSNAGIFVEGSEAVSDAEGRRLRPLAEWHAEAPCRCRRARMSDRQLRNRGTRFVRVGL